VVWSVRKEEPLIILKIFNVFLMCIFRNAVLQRKLTEIAFFVPIAAE
jgi:hypothetical protein